VTATVVQGMVKLPPVASIAVPTPSSSRASLPGAITKSWPWLGS
jgi:hypothetical protein